MSVMTPDMLRADLSRDGYVAILHLFDGDEIQELRTEVARYIRDVVPTMPDARAHYEDEGDPSSLKQIEKIFEYDGFFSELMNGRIIVETVLADDVVPVNMQYFNKPAGIGQAPPPHQDGYYFHLTPCEASPAGWPLMMSTRKTAAFTMCAARIEPIGFAPTARPAFLVSRKVFVSSIMPGGRAKT